MTLGGCISRRRLCHVQVVSYKFSLTKHKQKMINYNIEAICLFKSKFLRKCFRFVEVLRNFQYSFYIYVQSFTCLKYVRYVTLHVYHNDEQCAHLNDGGSSLIRRNRGQTPNCEE